MKSVPRMFDYERVMTYHSTQPERQTSLVKKLVDASLYDQVKSFNYRIDSLIHLIENSYNWSLDSHPGENVNLYMEPKEIAKELGRYEFHIDAEYLPKGFINNPYLISYVYNRVNAVLSAIIASAASDLPKEAYEKHHKDVPDCKCDFDAFNQTIIDSQVYDATNAVHKLIRQIFHYWKFHREEQNFYVHDANLIADLMKTEYPCRTDWLIPPNDSLYIMLPPNEYGAEGMYVNLEDHGVDDKLIRMYIPNRPNKSDRNVDPMSHGSYYWELIIKQNTNLHKAINQAIENSAPIQENAIEAITDDKDSNFTIGARMHYFTNLAVQTILYITSVNAEAVMNRRPKRELSTNRKKKFVNREETQTDYTKLGGDSIYINHRRRPGINKKDGTATGTGKKLNKLVLVRGHFAKYWLKNPAKIAALREYQIIDIRFDEMGKKEVSYKKYKKPFYRGRGEMIAPKEYKLK